MQVRFWGTRGSIAKPGPGTVRYGGNTSCVEVRSVAGTLVILDCGTGAHALGHALLAEGAPLRGHILITHTHWDHIQGIPFFLPLFVPGHEWDVYAPRGLSQSLHDALAGQMQYAYFPVALEELGATIRYHDLVEGRFEVGSVRVTARYLNHPALTLGYRLEADGVSVVYATDHEPYSRHLALEGGPVTGEDRRHAEFLDGADLVIHDAQYTAAEYPAKVGWGHSTVEYAVDLARATRVRTLALFHHDPLREDDAVDRLLDAARSQADSALEVIGAAEGAVVVLTPPVGAPEPMAGAALVSATLEPAAVYEQSILLAVADPATAAMLGEAARADAVRLLVAADGEDALRLARAEEPSLLLVDRSLPKRDAFALTRALRGDGAPYGKDVPVVVVANAEDPEDVQAGAAAGVTDWLVKPFSAHYARTRLRAWLLRRACRWRPAPRPPDEVVRQAALRRLGILDTAPEERFDRLTRVAAALFDVPIALVSLVDDDRQWFKSVQGLTVRETPREVAFCAHTIAGDDVMVVPDTLLDPRFADNPLVTDEPRIRFYAGYPLAVADGHRVGTLCIIDRRPRALDERALRLLREIGVLVQREMVPAP